MPTMNMSGDYKQEAILLEDRYPATLHSVEEYTRDYGDGEVPKLAWLFDVEAGEDAIDPDIEYEESSAEEFNGTFEVAAHTSFATGQTSNFAKLGFPALVGEDWTGNTDDLIGKRCLVDVTSYVTAGGNTRNVIERVRPLKKAPRAAAKTKAEQEEEKTFNEVPF